MSILKQESLLPLEEELRGFSRTIAEIDWLMLIVVLAFQFIQPLGEESRTAIMMALFFFAAFILSFRYANFYKRETRWKLALETLVMILFITWVVWYSGKLDSPLLSLYLLPIIASALALGKVATLLEMTLVTACYIFFSAVGSGHPVLSLNFGVELAAKLSPVLLVAYITTMLSADIHYALNKAKLFSETDPLTGLYNLRAFNIIADRAFNQAIRYSRPMSLVMIDSDNLKRVNDTFGHETGNRLLQQIVAGVKAQLRSTDVLARYGGDEFMVLLPDTGARGAREVAERIRRSVEAIGLTVRDTRVPTTVSLGVASYPDDGVDLSLLLDKADKAMYRSKQGGRNRSTHSTHDTPEVAHPAPLRVATACPNVR
ncbi:MAG: GGDEF domain-containing protein [Burkholderiales bacterium]|nr:GGDEF domain-containing protein [Burkholderiales bacterium]